MKFDIDPGSREQIRQLAGEYHAELAKAPAEGADLLHRSYELQDRIDAFVANLPLDVQERFRLLFAQELDAITASLNQETVRIETETQERNATYEALGGVLAVVAIGLIAIWLLF